MRELILRHAHAAGRNGSISLSTLTVARRQYRNVSIIQQRIRSQSTQTTSSSPVSSKSAPAIAGSFNAGQQSERRLAPSNAVAPPLPGVQPGQGQEPMVDASRIFAADGIVDSIASTRPPPLNLPEPPHPYAWPYKGNWSPSKWDFKYLYSLGKAYAAFYWAGVKQLYGNFKIMFKINSRLSGTFPDAAARYAAVPEKISYNDYVMMVRTRRDMRKCIPFLLVFAICGEFTPLVIVALGSRVVPGPCVIPKQTLHDRNKGIERDHVYNQELANLLRQCNGDLAKLGNDRRRVTDIYNLIAWRAGLTPFKKLPPIVGGLYFSLRTQKNLARHCDELLSIANLVQREGGWAKKSPQDMWEWGTKYGMYRLRKFAESAIARNEDPISEKMKAALLPHFEAEVRNMLQEDFSQIPRVSHCSIALNSPLYRRPDIDARNNSIQELASEAR